MGKYDNTFGSIVIATWVNAILLMIETMQLHHCLSTQSRLRIKCLALGCYTVDLVCSCAICAAVYMYTVTHWGDKQYGQSQDWPIPLELTSTATVSLCVQFFLIQRYYRLSKNPWITGVLIFIAIVAAVGAVSTAIIVIIRPSLSDRHLLAAPVMTWLVATSVVDWAIAASLVRELHKRRVLIQVKRTRRLISRLISKAARTGAFPSLVASLVLINYLHDKEGNVSSAFGFCLGRIYTITMLYNVNYQLEDSHPDRHHQNQENRRKPRQKGRYRHGPHSPSTLSRHGAGSISASATNLKGSSEAEDISGGNVGIFSSAVTFTRLSSSSMEYLETRGGGAAYSCGTDGAQSSHYDDDGGYHIHPHISEGGADRDARGHSLEGSEAV